MSLCIIFPSFHSVLSFSMSFVCLIDLRYCNNTFPFLSHLICRMTLSVLLLNDAKTYQIEPGKAKKGGAQTNLEKYLTLRIRHNEVLPKEVKLAIIYNIENSRVNSNLRVFPIFRTVNLSFLLLK